MLVSLVSSSYVHHCLSSDPFDTLSQPVLGKASVMMNTKDRMKSDGLWVSLQQKSASGKFAEIGMTEMCKRLWRVPEGWQQTQKTPMV